MQQAYDAPYLVIHRAEYLKVLVKEAKELGFMIHLGSVIETIDSARTSIHSDDGQILEPVLIIGADGERSFCRDSLLGYPDPPHPSGDVVFKVVLPKDKLQNNRALAGLVDPPAIHFRRGPNVHALAYTLGDGLLDLVLILPDSPSARVTIGARPADLRHAEHLVKEWDPQSQRLPGLTQRGANGSWPSAAIYPSGPVQRVSPHYWETLRMPCFHTFLRVQRRQ